MSGVVDPRCWDGAVVSRKECVDGLCVCVLNVEFIEIKGMGKRHGEGEAKACLPLQKGSRERGVWMGIDTARGLCLKLKEDLFDINVKAVCGVFAKNEQKHTWQNNYEMFSTRDARAVRQEPSH